jgi:hypothetical protein
VHVVPDGRVDAQSVLVTPKSADGEAIPLRSTALPVWLEITTDAEILGRLMKWLPNLISLLLSVGVVA